MYLEDPCLRVGASRLALLPSSLYLPPPPPDSFLFNELFLRGSPPAMVSHTTWFYMCWFHGLELPHPTSVSG